MLTFNRFGDSRRGFAPGRLFFFLLAVSLGSLRSAQADWPPAGPRVQLRMDSEPAYELAKMVPGAIDENLLPLWLSALDRPDRDLQRQVGDAISQARPLGMKGLDASVAARLRKAFEAADHRVVRRSLARALVAMDDRAAAELFWQASQEDYQLALIVHPVLGTWKYAPAVEASLARIDNPEFSAPLKRLAIELLANAGEAKSKPVLVPLVQTASARGDLRLAAADALAKIFSEGLDDVAGELSSRKRADDPLSGLLAARLLAHHSSSETVRALEQLARDTNTSVQGAALKGLGEIDHQLVAKFATDPALAKEFSVRHPDANVRRHLIESLYSIADLAAIPTLRTFLDDHHPANRTAAGDALYHLAQRNAAFRAAVDRELTLAFNESSWRTLERAAIVSGGLDLEGRANQLIPLLTHDRTEVAVAAAYALKEIAVPETLPIVLDRLKEHLNTKYDERTERSKMETAGLQSAHLCEQLGIMNYKPAEPELRRLIPQTDPKRELNDNGARASAIWALGWMYKDKPDAELISLFIARIKQMGAMVDPESRIVGEACAYALGWMMAEGAVGTLRPIAVRGFERSHSDAAAWALGRITGKPIPLPDPVAKPTPKWFLRAIPQAASNEPN